jgi:ATP sulfurylase
VKESYAACASVIREKQEEEPHTRRYVMRGKVLIAGECWVYSEQVGNVLLSLPVHLPIMCTY